jgi:hypothetical protein
MPADKLAALAEMLTVAGVEALVVSDISQLPAPWVEIETVKDTGADPEVELTLIGELGAWPPATAVKLRD